MARTKEEIGQEYGQLMKKAAELQYQIFCLSSDLKLTNETLQEINLEFASLPPESSDA